MNQVNKEELIERYIYDVTRRLPQRQKKDIGDELRGLIDDMLEARAGDTWTEEDLHQVLTELGEPAKLADQYRDNKRYLIGPAYFEQYLTTLKIVFPCVLFGITVASLLSSKLAGSPSFAAAVGYFFGNILSSMVQAFVWVTAIFFLIETQESKNPQNKFKAKEWTPADLPKVPSQIAMIPKSDPIVGLVFTALVIILFNVAPQLMGLYTMRNGLICIPIFDLEVLKSMLPLFNLSFAAGAVREMLKLIYGKYSMKLAWMIILLNLFTIALTIVILSNGAVWNQNFLPQLTSLYTDLPAEIHLPLIWNNMSKLFIAVVAFATLIDCAVTFFRSWRADHA